MYDPFLPDCGCVRIEAKLLTNASKAKSFGAASDYTNFFV